MAEKISQVAGAPGAPSRAELVLSAVTHVLRPLVELLLVSGVKHAAIDEALRELLVEVARRQVPGAAQSRAVSRISVATGIHRKDVKRLLTTAGRTAELGRRTASSEAFTRWLTDTRFLDARGRPRALLRQADEAGGPSFELLARETSRDVHPRTILDELLRLKLAVVDADDHVRLLTDAFVPAAGEREMFHFLSQNVGDHLCAAVANVEGQGDRFLEQAVFADELSEESVADIEQLARDHWQRLLREVVPRLQALVDRDRAEGRPARRRARIGMYSYAASMDESRSDASPVPPAAEGTSTAAATGTSTAARKAKPAPVARARKPGEARPRTLRSRATTRTRKGPAE